MSNAEAGRPSTPHEIRITHHGKIANWVTFALDYFKKYEERPLVLHTLPATQGRAGQTTDDREIGAQGQTSDSAVPAGARTNRKRAEGLHPSMATIPRLVSVVEIIKREYLKTLDAALAERGCLSGLHQYNEVGDLVEAGYVERRGDEGETGERMENLAHALQGRHHVQQKKVAFMRVTLCRKAVPELVKDGATYQPPSVRRLSRSARARIKKKLRKQA
ncbi:hypothetical protein BD414DRAFT_470611 [Trametes punicea]|nr:hypothetical protein BD414DRAFT_470611 [Trametes punicea]